MNEIKRNTSHYKASQQSSAIEIKGNNRKKCSDIELAQLMDEANFLCPLCGHRLAVEKNGKISKQFDIAHIYPHSPTPEQVEALKNVKKPENTESLENLTPLCLNCHRLYDSNTTEEDYWKLYHKKRAMIRNFLGKQATANLDIESEIQEVVTALLGMTREDIDQLTYSPVSIDQKVHDPILNKLICDDISQFYRYIETLFRELDDRHTGTFDNIAAAVKRCFLKQESEQWFQTEEKLFEHMVSWLATKTGGPHRICAIIISFFVQNCEVFRDSAE